MSARLMYLRIWIFSAHITDSTGFGEMRNGGLPIMGSLKKSKTVVQLSNRSFAHYTEIQEILKLHFPVKYRDTGNIEASFSSKMLATVDVNKPIWDRYVASNLCLNLKGKTKDEQLECAIDLYNQMICWYEDFVKTENGKECIAEFNKILPDYAWMSDVKKIDFYLWSKRER